MRKRFIYQEHDIYIAEHHIIGKLHILQPVSIENDIADQVELTEQLQELSKIFNSCSPEMTRMFSIEWQLLSFQCSYAVNLVAVKNWWHKQFMIIANVKIRFCSD